jgi:type IV secretory pathway VirB10-like protein
LIQAIAVFGLLNGGISMCMSAEVLNGRILRAIEVIRSTLQGLPEGDGGVSTFQVVTVLTNVEEALLGMSDAPDTTEPGVLELNQGPPIGAKPQPQPAAETAAPPTPAAAAESTAEEDFVLGEAPEPTETKEEKRPAETLAARHRSQTLAEVARLKTQKFHAERAKAAKAGGKSAKDDSEQTAAQRIRAAQRATGL